MRCEKALVRVCDGLREDGEVDWQIARAARVKIARNSASMNRGLGGRGGRRTARSAAFMAHLNRPGLKKCACGRQPPLLIKPQILEVRSAPLSALRVRLRSLEC